MKKKKIFTLVISSLLPVLIFLLCTYLNGYLPFKDEMLNSYDSFTQYPGILLEYINGLKIGNIFYSWHAGFGFNLFGTITYYCMSPLNLLAVFATPQNYPFFICALTFLRFALLGATMSIYLNHTKIKPLYVILFSTIYALMGYTSTYYYNFIWIDSIIALPIVMLGLDNLIEGKSPALYYISLTFTILINYYIGYMICIFSLIWFIYNIIEKKNKKELIKRFSVYSLLSGLTCAITILPSMFALLTGKASIYSRVDYTGFTKNTLNIFYTLTPGAYSQGDQILGPGLIYSSILVLVLTCFYFFNTKFSKKKKVATLIILIFFYLSLSVRFLNYAWQFFQKPIWWQSRFSFLISFFLITLASSTLSNIKFTQIKTKHRFILAIILIVLTSLGAFFKWNDTKNIQNYTYFFFGFSLLLILEILFLVDKKEFLTMIIVFTFIELSLNTFNSLKQNYRYKSYTQYDYIKKELPPTLEKLNQKEDYFYRLEFIDDYMSNDGLYFGFNGVNYFNSVRNIDVVTLTEKLGFKVADHCHFILDDFDPIILSIFNIKYLFGATNEYYYKKVDKYIYENANPLSLGFTASSKIKNFEFLSDNSLENRERLLQSLSGLDDKIYSSIYYNEFTKSEENKKNVFTHTFKSDGHYLIIPEDFGGSIKVNNDEQKFTSFYREIFKNDLVKIKYEIAGSYAENKIKFHLLDLDAFDKHINILNKNLLKATTNTDGHILSSTIDITEDHDYLFTSIEYEQGMKVYVDDVEVEPDIILNSLIGLPLSKGKHKIVIDYIPKGFIPGLIITVSGLTLSTSLLILNRTKKRKHLD